MSDSRAPAARDGSQRSEAGRVHFVGAFPPPVHGMSMVNEVVARRLREAGAEVDAIDVSAQDLDRSWRARLGRLPAVVRGLARTALAPSGASSAFYLSVSGGLGQVYDLAFVAVARAKKHRIYLHYHSFAYLDRPSRLTRVLTSIAGSGATHVVLSSGMGALLRSRYPAADRVTPVSNAGLVGDGATQRDPREHLETIGFLSNIAIEKGILDFLDVAEQIGRLEPRIRALIAGPFQDDATEALVRSRIDVIPSTTYVGPKYGQGKAEFLATLDVLVFPTRYRNEAEPLVVHEALASATPVIARARGAIREVVGPECGLVIDEESDFVRVAVDQVRRWVVDPVAYRRASRAAVERARDLHRDGAAAWRDLERDILGR